jgi:hypothetical protein
MPNLMEAIDQKKYQQLKIDIEKSIEQLAADIYKQREDKVRGRLAALLPKTHETKDTGYIG